MSEVQPGQTATGARGASQQWDMMQSRELAWLQLQQNPPPLPAKYSPPLTEKEWEEAVQMYLDRLGETILQAWDQVHEQRLGHIPDPQFAAIFAQHEPLYIAGWQVMEAQLAEQVVAGVLDPEEAEARVAIAAAEPSLQGPVPNPWLAGLMSTCAYQARKDLQRYARIRARQEQSVA